MQGKKCSCVFSLENFLGAKTEFLFEAEQGRHDLGGGSLVKSVFSLGLVRALLVKWWEILSGSVNLHLSGYVISTEGCIALPGCYTYIFQV